MSGRILLTWFTRTMRRRQLLLVVVTFGPLFAAVFILLDAADAIFLIATCVLVASLLYALTPKR